MQGDEVEGLKLCCRFALTPSSRGYCGRDNASKALVGFIQNGTQSTAAQVQEILLQFPSLPAYIKAIAGNESPFGRKIIEAYWIGNELLDRFKGKDCCGIIQKLRQTGMQESRAKELISKMPDGAIPNHNFHALYVEVDQAMYKIENMINHVLKCTIAWATIDDVLENRKLSVTGPLIEYKDNRFSLSKPKAYTISYDPKLIIPKKGRRIAVHWDEGVCALTQEQAQNLEKYTQKAIEAVNSSRLAITA